jgi:hypothetical protein
MYLIDLQLPGCVGPAPSSSSGSECTTHTWLEMRNSTPRTSRNRSQEERGKHIHMLISIPLVDLNQAQAPRAPSAGEKQQRRTRTRDVCVLRPFHPPPPSSSLSELESVARRPKGRTWLLALFFCSCPLRRSAPPTPPYGPVGDFFCSFMKGERPVTCCFDWLGGRLLLHTTNTNKKLDSTAARRPMMTDSRHPPRPLRMMLNRVCVCVCVDVQCTSRRTYQYMHTCACN